MSGRRLLALGTLLAVLWSALWPLVAHAAPRADAGEHAHCEETSGAPPAPVKGPGKAPHCPFCVPVADVTPSLPPQLASRASAAITGLDIAHASPARASARLHPPSQAPPPLS